MTLLHGHIPPSNGRRGAVLGLRDGGHDIHQPCPIGSAEAAEAVARVRAIVSPTAKRKPKPITIKPMAKADRVAGQVVTMLDAGVDRLTIAHALGIAKVSVHRIARQTARDRQHDD